MSIFDISAFADKKKKTPIFVDISTKIKVFSLVAEVGFEPTASGL
jgi:hypothetical protein